MQPELNSSLLKIVSILCRNKEACQKLCRCQGSCWEIASMEADTVVPGAIQEWDERYAKVMCQSAKPDPALMALPKWLKRFA